MHNSWVYITNGLQNKASFMHTGMGNHQTGRVYDHVIIEDDIKIQNPGAKPYGIRFTPQTLLDALGFV